MTLSEGSDIILYCTGLRKGRGLRDSWTLILGKCCRKMGIGQTLPCSHSSVGKESACSAGDPGLIPRSGRSAGEGIGYPLQYSRASLVAQLVKNPPAVWETWLQSLGWEDPWRMERLPILLFWPGEFHGLYSPWGRKESDMIE